MNAAVVELFDEVDDLIRRVAHTEIPEIRKVRAKVHAALVVAKNAVEDVATTAPSYPDRTIEPARSEYAGEDSLALGIALLLGLGLGLMVPARR